MENELRTMKKLCGYAKNVADAEANYLAEKQKLEVLKANYILNNDWEKLLGKPKPTQKDKDAFITLKTEAMQKKVNEAKVRADYCKRIYEINVLLLRD